MKKLTLVLSLFAIASCTDPKMETIEKLKSECIASHDEVMPRMNELTTLSSALKEWHDQIALDSSSEVTALRLEVSENIAMLDSADDVMMNWMAHYDPDYAAVNHIDSAVSYYTRQREEIIVVKSIMEESINDAKALLDKK